MVIEESEFVPEVEPYQLAIVGLMCLHCLDFRINPNYGLGSGLFPFLELLRMRCTRQ